MSARDSHLPPPLRRALLRVTGKHLGVRLVSGGAAIVTAVAALLLAQLALDRALDFPRAVRAALLVIDAIVIGSIFWRRVWLPARRRWRVADAAFALQRRWPELGSSVISAVQLAPGGAGDARGAGSPALVSALVEETAARVSALPVGQVVAAAPAARRVAIAALLVAVAAGLGFWRADLASVLLRRAALREVPLPSSTLVVPETRDLLVARGTAAIVAARAEGVVPRQGRLEIKLAGGERRVLLVAPDAADPARFSYTLENVQQSFGYRFFLGDGKGPSFDVDTQPVPLLEGAEFLQIFPAYTGRPVLRQPAGALTFFPGAKVQVTARASQSLGRIELRLVGVDVAPVALRVDRDNPRLAKGEFTVPARGLTGLSLPLASDRGIEAPDATIYPVTVETDRPPVVKITAPVVTSETIVTSAQLAVRATLSDDFGVARAELVRVINGVETRVPLDIGADRGVAYDFAPSFEDPPMTEGTEITWWIEAFDNNDVTGPGVGSSDRRTLGIVSFAQKQREMLQRLEETSRRVEEVARRQGDIRDALGEALRKLTPAPAPQPTPKP